MFPNEVLVKLARTGYEGYAKKTLGKTFDGRPMPKWEDLPPHTVEAWKAAVLAMEGERSAIFSEHEKAQEKAVEESKKQERSPEKPAAR
jgi:hypothetical protein